MTKKRSQKPQAAEQVPNARVSPILDLVAAKIHENWRAILREQGVVSRKSTWGEELFVSYFRLSERAREYNREMVRQTIAALGELM